MYTMFTILCLDRRLTDYKLKIILIIESIRWRVHEGSRDLLRE